MPSIHGDFIGSGPSPGLIGPTVPREQANQPVAVNMARAHSDGTAHPDQDWTGALPQEATTELESHQFLRDPTSNPLTGGTGRIDGPGFHYITPCCIHGYCMIFVHYWGGDLQGVGRGGPSTTGPTHPGPRWLGGGAADGGWAFLGVLSCPHNAGTHGPHGRHISTSSPVRLLLDDPLTTSPEQQNRKIPVAAHHHVYTAETDPFGLVWDHNHSYDQGRGIGWTGFLEGSNGWPRGQNAPNQTYTHTHVISTIAGNPQRLVPASLDYSPEEGIAGGLSSAIASIWDGSPQMGYDHQHDHWGMHFHFHQYTHTHYADDIAVPRVEPWSEWFDQRPPWWQDGMEEWFRNPTDLPWLSGMNDFHVGEGLIWGYIPTTGLGNEAANRQARLAEVNAIAAGYNPELIFLGGDVHGVQGVGHIAGDGRIGPIQITDPGATVVNVTEGTADDVDGDGIVSPDILITKPIGTDTQVAAWISEFGSAPFDWFKNFSATAHISDNPTIIAGHLPQFFKDEAELRADAASSGYVDPIAQTFMVNIEDAPNGLFIESVDLCFQNKPAFGNDGDPITVEIRPTINGYPSSEEVLSGYGGASASRTLNAAEVNVADAYPTTAIRDWEDPSLFHMNRYNGLLPGFSGLPYAVASPSGERQIGRARGGRRGGGRGLAAQNHAYVSDRTLIPPKYTRFVFSSPIFLSRNTEYAIVVRSNSDEYMCWISDSRSVAGATTSAVGATGGSATENFGFAGNPNLASHEGPQFGGSFFKSQNGRTWTADQNKDLMFRVNRAEFTSSQGTVGMSAGHWLGSDFEYDRAELDEFSLMTPESTLITQTYQTKTSAAPGTFTDAIDVSDLFLTTKSFSERMVLGQMLNSGGDGGDFKINSTLSTNDPRVSPVIDRTNINLKTIRNRINDGRLSNNQINIVNHGHGWTDHEEVDVHAGGGTEAKIKVRTGVAGHITSAYVSVPGSGYYKAATANIASSTISQGGDGNAIINLLGEEGVSGGNGQARYITKSVTLASNMDAIDLKVYLTASKPEGASIRVYYRVSSQYDQQSINEKKWTAMEMVSPDENATGNDIGDGIEPSPLEFEFGTVDDHITYSSGDQTFSDFKMYQIKIVSFATNYARVPILSDFRAIAVT